MNTTTTTPSANKPTQANKATQANKPTPVFSADGRRMATITGRTFEKSVDGTKHFLRRPPAIAMDKYVFDIHAKDFDDICITDRETGTKYLITRADFEKNRFEVARGYGTQYGVAFGFWHQPGKPAAAVAGPVKPLSLFDDF